MGESQPRKWRQWRKWLQLKNKNSKKEEELQVLATGDVGEREEPP